MKIIYATYFTGKTPWGNGFKSQEWYDYRASIFIKYTLKSLMQQTDKDFLMWLQFRPEEKENPTTKIIEDALKSSGLEYVLTFNSPIMMEDRAIWHNINLQERASKSLKELEPLIKDEWVCEVCLDSDDMVSKDFTEVLRSKTPVHRGAFYMKNGYMMKIDGRIAEWHNPESMSIYAIVYPTKTFLDGREHFLYHVNQTVIDNGQFTLSSHEQIPKLFNAELLPDGMFCCLAHEWNISTVWTHPYKGQEFYSESEKKNIINKFL